VQVLVAGIIDSRPMKGDTVCCELTMRLNEGGDLVEDKHIITFTLGDSEVGYSTSISIL